MGTDRVAWVVGAALLALPRTAHATSMDGLAVVVVGMFVAAPAALILLGMIVAMAVALGGESRRTTGARVVQIASPLLGVAYPLIYLAMGGTKGAAVALLFDLPVLVLAVVAFVLACVVVRKRERIGG